MLHTECTAALLSRVTCSQKEESAAQIHDTDMTKEVTLQHTHSIAGGAGGAGRRSRQHLAALPQRGHDGRRLARRRRRQARGHAAQEGQQRRVRHLKRAVARMAAAAKCMVRRWPADMAPAGWPALSTECRNRSTNDSLREAT